MLTVVLGASLLGSGLASWRARPENRLGPVMVLTAFGFFASQLTEASRPWMYTIGTAVQYVWLIGFLYLLLDVPVREAVGPARPVADGSASSRCCASRSWPCSTATRRGCAVADCPDNLIQIVHNNQEALNLLDLQRLVGSALLLVIVVVLIRRWRRASAARRRAVAPVLVAGCATLRRPRPRRRRWTCSAIRSAPCPPTSSST